MRDPRFRPSSLAHVAVVTIALLGSAKAGWGQFRVDEEDGAALDANPRIGSSGHNGRGDDRRDRPSGNQIVTGNVTGGREFRGNIDYTDPREFRDATGGESFDRFTRDSTGAASAARGGIDLNVPRPFYGQSRTVNPPDGYVRPGYGVGGYVPQSSTLRSYQELGPDNVVRTIPSPTSANLLIPGPQDRANQPMTLYQASPLLGVREIVVPAVGEGAIAETDTLTTPRTTGEENAAAPANNAQPAPSGETGAVPSETSFEQAGEPTQTTRYRMLSRAADSGIRIGQGRPQIDRFQRRDTLTDEEAGQLFRADRHTRNTVAPANREAPVARPPRAVPAPPAQEMPAHVPAIEDTGSETNVAPRREVVADVQPPSETNGNAADITETLRKGEELIQQGKWTSAIDQYEFAQRLAPANAEVLLGRAHAELGASYYNKAEVSLRKAVAANASILAQRQDLKGLYGDARLAIVTRDLREQVNSRPSDARPALLLAYVAHHTGNAAETAEYLGRAVERTRGDDALVSAMQAAWQPASK